MELGAIDEQYLTLCRKRIEEKIGWGSSTDWSTQDFEELSEQICEATGRPISATTLKRIWGRVKYESSPSLHTLDTLGRFLGARSWRTFKQHHGVLQEPVATSVTASPDAGLLQTLQPSRRPKWGRRTIEWGAVLVLVSFLGINLFSKKSGMLTNTETTDISFSSYRVSEGLPNTVVFRYNVSNVEADSFFIQQSWDPRLRHAISPEDHEFTSLYYYPGYFRAKLIANETELREHPVMVPTKGWLALVEQEASIPIYVPQEASFSDGVLQASPAWLTANSIDARAGAAWLSYFLVRDFGALDSDAFSLEAEIRNDVDAGRAICRHSQVIVMAEQGHMFVPLSIPGCVADLNLTFSEVEVKGRTNDLSGLGTDLSTWQRLRLEVQQRHVTIFLNDTPVYQSTYQEGMGMVFGLQFRFLGLGAVNYVRLRDGKSGLVYQKDF